MILKKIQVKLIFLKYLKFKKLLLRITETKIQKNYY